MVPSRERNSLIVGWFSFEQQGATAGDLLVRDLVSKWLADADIKHSVVVAEPFDDGLRWDAIDPQAYTDLLFVCGPFGNGWPITDLLRRFSHCRIHGINLTVLENLDSWNPFTNLLERDSSRASRPDLVFLSPPTRVPIVGLVLVHRQLEYGAQARHTEVDEIVRNVLDQKDVAIVPIDTRLDVNSTGLRSPAQVESLIARMDVVVTTRLHGTVLALKNGVPVVPIDPIAGGAKITKQIATIGWPILLDADTLTHDSLKAALEACLTESMRERARECGDRARHLLKDVPRDLIAAMGRIS